jgi:CRISPR-associated endonuclease Cas1
MRSHDNSLALTKDGVLIVSAWAVELRVSRGHLNVIARTGRDMAEITQPRVSRPRLRRVVISSRGGFITWESVSWLRGIGASLVQLDHSGEVLATSHGLSGPDQPALRRAQVEAMYNETGLDVARYLLGIKLRAQRANLEAFGQQGSPGLDELTVAVGRIATSNNISEALAAEARAATVYWGELAILPVRFARTDSTKVPASWTRLGERHSPLSGSPRLATTPAHAMVNYLYGLGEFACSIALTALGLDPGLGWVHKDASHRHSASLDLLETIRGDLDAFALALLAERTFPRTDFIETATGQVRVGSGLAKLLAESGLNLAERRVAPIAEEVARMIAASARSKVIVRTRLTQASRKGSRTGTRVTRRVPKVPPACRSCGLVLDDPQRVICDDCLPDYATERSEKLARAGRAALVAMRTAPDDPAKSPEARAKRAETSRARMSAIRAWEREHGTAVDRVKYEAEIVPALKALTVPAIMAVTGLSQHYCWQVRTGRKRLHPMHWVAVLKLPPSKTQLTRG